ncbi:hypothetical protein [Staphylococcus kloosii]|jgi:hypothetical protein|uniref:hypothetical protein n=1 Tax=Staphylococcus kloosii TaxID=29384 RepID=UPI000D1F8B72|nr:hypothetical protein [Staphylococcus kloosii]MBF7022488.1 hypothetical protein [Staphylococcus kloosii]PTJ79255.1 hypothetical protein BUZ59_04290 [Staphylococcus kloosii]
MIQQELVDQFKARNRIFYDMEDERIKNDLALSYIDIKNKCGYFDIDELSLGRELVFERTRYILNDKLEEFNDNFLSSIVQFQIINVEVFNDDSNT